MFWICVSTDLKPFRPVRKLTDVTMTCRAHKIAKFLCVKGILFFSFWQSIAVSFLVAVKAIKQSELTKFLLAEHVSKADHQSDPIPMQNTCPLHWWTRWSALRCLCSQSHMYVHPLLIIGWG